MPAPDSPCRAPSAATVALYNAVPSVLWSALVWGPVVLFCCRYASPAWVYGFGGAGLLAYAWPAAWLRRLQLSGRVAVYEQLRVPALNRFTQQGAVVNALLRRRYPGYRALAGRRGAARLRRTTYQQERFHWAALVFMALLSGYAGATGHWGWALSLGLANVGYNLYPIWLQQYLRLRLARWARGA